MVGRRAGSGAGDRFEGIEDGQAGRYHGLDEVSRCYFADFSVGIPSVHGQVGCAVVVIPPQALHVASILRDRRMAMNEVYDTCKWLVEYQGQFFSRNRYNTRLSSISHYGPR